MRGYRYALSGTVIAMLTIDYVTGTAVPREIIQTEQPGCVAKVRTDSDTKWIYLRDDYKLVKNSE